MLCAEIKSAFVCKCLMLIYACNDLLTHVCSVWVCFLTCVWVYLLGIWRGREGVFLLMSKLVCLCTCISIYVHTQNVGTASTLWSFLSKMKAAGIYHVYKCDLIDRGGFTLTLANIQQGKKQMELTGGNDRGRQSIMNCKCQTKT